jgi:hypothetical protein
MIGLSSAESFQQSQLADAFVVPQCYPALYNLDTGAELNEQSWAPPLKWHLSTQTELSLQEHNQFWGDEYGWTSLLPVVWAGFEKPGFVVQPDFNNVEGPEKDYLAASYWSAAIHLLGLGLGWTNIGEGLRFWRSETDYLDRRHPILDFLKRTYGSDLRALETWFGVEKRTQIYDALRQMSDRELPDLPESEYVSTYNQWEIEYLEDDPRSPSSIASQLLLDGYDALHLEPHIAGSFTGKNSSLRKPFIQQKSNELDFTITFDDYAGWGLQLAQLEELEQFTEDGFRLDSEINLQINRFGGLGRFLHHNESGRWFLFSDLYGAPSLQWDAHRWGNPNPPIN